MKKLLLIMPLMALILLGCSNDDDNENDVVINGTLWERIEKSYADEEGMVEASRILFRFKSDNTFLSITFFDENYDGKFDFSEKDDEEINGTYSLKGNKAKLYIGKTYVGTCVFKGKKMILTDSDGGKDITFNLISTY